MTIGRGDGSLAATMLDAGSRRDPSRPPFDRPAPAAPARSQALSLWNVVLLDDDDHTYDYVIEMLMNLCGHSLEGGLRAARAVGREGRAVIFTGHRELAELKVEQIGDFGVDPRLAGSSGPMSAILEPAR